MKEIRKVTIAGAGTMGHSMAQIFARYGYAVTLYNHRQPTLDKAKEKIRENTDVLAAEGEITPAEAEALKGRITYTTSPDCFGTCDLVVENIKEDKAAKSGFYKEISPLVPADVIIATNTSGLSINGLAASVDHPERFLGMHWFNPPHIIPLIEIVRGDATTDEAAQKIYQLALALHKKPVLVNKDVLGFAANRIQLAVLREALYLVDQGVVSEKGIDDLMKYGIGFRWACLGPLEVTDFGGIDTFYHIAEYLMPDLCASKEIPRELARHYEAGEYGVKTGKGFHDYSGGKAQEATAERDRRLVALYRAFYKE